MPYTPPSQRSPAVSANNSPSASRRSSYQPGQPSAPPQRPELPRSTSYLTRHRRTPSVKTAAFEPTLELTPPGTADKEKDDRRGLTAMGSLRQSPPPATDESQMPAGAIISPPESSDEDDTSESRGRKLEAEKLVELEAAIRVIEQHRQSSQVKTAPEAVGVLEISPKKDLPTAEHIETASQNLRKISHSRSNTESVFIDLRNSNSPDTPTPSTGSDEDDLTDDDTPDRPRRKPQMLRKKSGELVRPALRPSSARRRPSSMPGTPTFSKAVHFDAHLEHVRHFLQVDRPLAVSASSSPVEAYDSDTEFPFSEDGSSTSRSLPFEWEIIVSNFPAPTPHRLSLPVRVERVFLSADNKTLIGSVAVANLAFNKTVIARFTLDYWKTTSEVVAEFNNDIRQPKHPDGCDRFNFNIKLADQANLEAKTMFFCVKYCVNGQEYWDNNNSTNFQIDFRKKAKPMNGKRGAQPASSKPVNSLPRSNKKSPPISSGKKNTTFDDFADGFDKYKYDEFHQPDYLGESSSLRLKGVKSAVNITSPSVTRRAPTTNGQAFGNRYDFGASLSAAINAANTALGSHSGLTLKTPATKQIIHNIPDSDDVSPLTMKSSQNFNRANVEANKRVPAAAPIRTSGTDSPRPAGTEKPVLASQSYNELLDKYCFFGSVKSSPQLKDGSMRSGQFDGSNEEGYILGSAESTANNSPLQMMMDQSSSPTRSQVARSASPAPMTGFVTGTSPMYPHQMHVGFPFHDAHAATAIKG